MSMFGTSNPDYDSFRKSDDPDVVKREIRTKQSFKDQTDINKILKKGMTNQTLSHLQEFEGVYGDFSDIDDLLTAHERLERGIEIFNKLPSEIRDEFGQSPSEFFNFVNDPANAGNLQSVLPQLAEPGRQAPAVRRSAATEANPALASAPPETAPPSVSEAPPEPPASSST